MLEEFFMDAMKVRVYLEGFGNTKQKQNTHKIVTTEIHFNTWREFVSLEDSKPNFFLTKIKKLIKIFFKKLVRFYNLCILNANG